ncbi:beta-ketoacyl-ACP synthase 3 [Streptomyces xiamenensis]
MTRTVRATGTGYSTIEGIGGYRPREVVTNATVCERIDSTEEWIETRSGIRERRFAAPDETLSMMATAAADKALARAGVPAADIDLVLLASMSHLTQTPPLAVVVAHELGATGAAGIDLSAACAGFVHALAMGSDAVRGGSARHVLVIGAERMTDIVEPTDRSVAFLFADGAGAAVIGPSPTPRIGPVVRGAHGAYQDALRMDGPWAATDNGSRPWMRMDGRRVFRWAMDEVTPAAARALTAAGITPAELDAFVPHQANLRMIALMTERLGLPPTTAVAQDVITSGNTSAASIPLALEALLAGGPAVGGGTALLAGFGAGLNYAALTVVLP